MNWNKNRGTLCLTLGFAVFFYGCGAYQKPAGPALSASLRVNLKVPGVLRPNSLGNVSSNELLYRVIGPGGIRRASGTVGPFTTANVDGTFDFSVAVPVGPDQVLALQLNNASDHTPLAVGAVPFSVNAQGQIPAIALDLGSVAPNGPYDVSNNTVIQGCANIGYGYEMLFNYPVTYIVDFNVDQVSGDEFEINCTYNTDTLTDRNLAYMGKGELVDFAYIPSGGHFHANSTEAKETEGAERTSIEVGDVYCIKLYSVPGGHAWIKFYGSGDYSIDDPKFIYRINGSGLPFFLYDNTYDNRALGYGHQNNC